MNKLVLVEPICTGSRLLYLAKVVETLQDTYSITVLTRSNYDTVHFNEVMHDVAFEIVRVDVDLSGEQIRNLSVREWMRYLAALHAYDGTSSETYDVLFLALDDYMLSFALTALYSFRLKSVRTCYVIKYRVGPLLTPGSSLRNIVLYCCMNFVSVVWKMQFIVFDERLVGKKVGTREVKWIPDFWSGEFACSKRSVARERYGYSDSDFVALAIGAQNDRKGFDVLLDMLPQVFEAIPDLKLCVHGKVQKNCRQLFASVCDQWPDNVKHYPDYISEKELPLPYAMASVVLMPYHPSFSATSGVLPRAAASGVPVVTSDHGLIGERVGKYDLGETFKYGDMEGFINAVKKVRRSGKNLKHTRGKFAESCSEVAFKKRLREIVCA